MANVPFAAIHSSVSIKPIGAKDTQILATAQLQTVPLKEELGWDERQVQALDLIDNFQDFTAEVSHRRRSQRSNGDQWHVRQFRP